VVVPGGSWDLKCFVERIRLATVMSALVVDWSVRVQRTWGPRPHNSLNLIPGEWLAELRETMLIERASQLGNPGWARDHGCCY
jgi:hypothetical protein